MTSISSSNHQSHLYLFLSLRTQSRALCSSRALPLGPGLLSPWAEVEEEAWLPSCLFELSTVESQSSFRAMQAPVPGIMPREEAQIQRRREELDWQGVSVLLCFCFYLFLIFYFAFSEPSTFNKHYTPTDESTKSTRLQTINKSKIKSNRCCSHWQQNNIINHNETNHWETKATSCFKDYTEKHILNTRGLYMGAVNLVWSEVFHIIQKGLFIL